MRLLDRGGNSYYAGLYGWACDNVANFEVVLANGNIVSANATTRADLWTALKGGSGDFGIVTRLDMHTFPTHDLWGGVRVAKRKYGNELAQTLIDFTNNNENNPKDAYIINYTYGPLAPDIVVAHVIVNTNVVANASAFSEVLQVPIFLDDVKKRSMLEMGNSYLFPSGSQYVHYSFSR
jgi:hypothetical protein